MLQPALESYLWTRSAHGRPTRSAHGRSGPQVCFQSRQHDTYTFFSHCRAFFASFSSLYCVMLFLFFRSRLCIALLIGGGGGTGKRCGDGGTCGGRGTRVGATRTRPGLNGAPAASMLGGGGILGCVTRQGYVELDVAPALPDEASPTVSEERSWSILLNNHHCSKLSTC